MAHRTKADLRERIQELEGAFDRLLASHKDCVSGLPFDQEWAKRVERETEMIRFYPRHERGQKDSSERR